MRLALGVLVDCVGRVLVSLGASHTSLKLIMVGIQFSKFLFMVAFHIGNVVLIEVDGEHRCASWSLEEHWNFLGVALAEGRSVC